MLFINKTSIKVNHKKARSKNSMEEKKERVFPLELDMTLTSA